MSDASAARWPADEERPAARRQSLSRAENARATRLALIKAGLKVVARHGYAKASVARITEATGVAAGTFYTYFDSHEQFIDQLLPAEGIRLLEALGKSTHQSTGYFDHERRAFVAFFEYLKRRPHFLRVLAEAEIAAPASYAQHMLNIEERYLRALHRAQERGEIRSQPERSFRVIAEVLSGARGHIAVGFSDRSGARAFRPVVVPDWVADTYVKFIRHGLGCRLPPVARGRAPTRRRRAEAPADTRSALLQAGARVIHRLGHAGATVQAVTQEAGVAVGTFYSHFASQQALFDALLADVRMRMLSDLRETCRGSVSFPELELRGFEGFFRHLLHNPWYVRIETASAILAPQSYLGHFFDLADRYTAALRRSHRAGELQPYEDRELPVLACIFMAARHYLATRYLVASPEPKPLAAHVTATYMNLICRGLGK